MFCTALRNGRLKIKSDQNPGKKYQTGLKKAVGCKIKANEPDDKNYFNCS